MTSPAHPQPNYDMIARPYRWLEHLTFGCALERMRLHFLPRLTHCRSALILGDGDGRFCAALLRAVPRLHAIAVDLSPTMLHLLARRSHAAHPTASLRLQTRAVDALSLDLSPGLTFDLVATHFFLDCMTQPELDQLCARVRQHLPQGATWVLSEFQIPSTGLMHWVGRLLVRALYLGFRLLTGLRTTRLPDHARALRRIGLVRTAKHDSLGGILTTEIWQLIPDGLPSEPMGCKLPVMLPPQRHSSTQLPQDPVPNPEPASPSLPEPDPGVFHHEPAPPQPPSLEPQP